MSRTVCVAAIQMDASPAPIAGRLARAGRLVAQAAGQGAQLVVLPELFTVGYGYTEANHRLAEPLSGPTAAWMKETAARFNVHLAGTLMLLEEDEVYNALLLFAPDGRMWRYDKNYPWGWERGYFRERKNVIVAHTDLGDIGMLICWDIAHLELWRAYAGQVDLMIAPSCPPNISNSTFHLPGGAQVMFREVGPQLALLQDSGRLIFDETPRRQAAWLGVPTVVTVGCGHIRTPIPSGRLAILGLLPVAPWLIKYLSEADRLEMSSDFVQGCQIIGADGQTLAGVTQEQGESFTIAELTVPDRKPVPHELQPASILPRILYLLSDVLLFQMVIPVYRRGLRRVLGSAHGACAAGDQTAGRGAGTGCPGRPHGVDVPE